MSTSFGPTALVTPANGVTMARVLITPLLLLWIAGAGASWPALVLWVVLAVTDGLDGYVARRHGTTRSGAFLDPLADKFLVLGALVVLAGIGRFGWLPVGLIATREIAMSGYRWRVSRRGVSIPARQSAKVKTVLQDLAIGLALLPTLDGRSDWVADTVLWAAVGLTLISGVQYLIDGRRSSFAV
jgi:CDP-diacylglycerol---glycerol-3-phosphate 3-phosphatidyltransferase